MEVRLGNYISPGFFTLKEDLPLYKSLHTSVQPTWLYIDCVVQLRIK